MKGGEVSVKVETRSTSGLTSTLYILPLFYLRALMSGAKNALVEIHPNVTYVSRIYLYGSFVLDYLTHSTCSPACST